MGIAPVQCGSRRGSALLGALRDREAALRAEFADASGDRGRAERVGASSGAGAAGLGALCCVAGVFAPPTRRM